MAASVVSIAAHSGSFAPANFSEIAATDFALLAFSSGEVRDLALSSGVRLVACSSFFRVISNSDFLCRYAVRIWSVEEERVLRRCMAWRRSSRDSARSVASWRSRMIQPAARRAARPSMATAIHRSHGVWRVGAEERSIGKEYGELGVGSSHPCCLARP